MLCENEVQYATELCLPAKIYSYIVIDRPRIRRTDFYGSQTHTRSGVQATRSRPRFSLRLVETVTINHLTQEDK